MSTGQTVFATKVLREFHSITSILEPKSIAFSYCGKIGAVTYEMILNARKNDFLVSAVIVMVSLSIADAAVSLGPIKSVLYRWQMNIT